MLSNTTICTLNKDLFIKVKNETFQLLIDHCCNHGGKIAMALKYPKDEIAKLYFVDFQVLNDGRKDECLSVYNYNEDGVLLDHKFYGRYDDDYNVSADMTKLMTETDYMESFCESLYCDIKLLAKLLNKIILVNNII